MKASPFAEYDEDASRQHEALKTRARDFAQERPLKGFAPHDDEEQVVVRPWEADDEPPQPSPAE